MAQTPARARSPTYRTEWLTVRDVAVLLRVGEGTVRRWIRAGRLQAKFFGGRIGYRISDRDLETFLGAAPGEVRGRVASYQH